MPTMTDEVAKSGTANRPAEPLFRGVGSSPLPILDKAFWALARRLQISLLSRLSEDVKIAVEGVHTTTLGSAFTLLEPTADDAVYAVLRFGGTRTPGFIGFQNALMRPLIGRMLGSGELKADATAGRPLSMVELRIANRVAQAVGAALQAEGRDDVMPRMSMGTVTNGARHLDEADMGTSSVVCQFLFGDNGALGRAALCVPVVVAEALVAQHPDTGNQPGGQRQKTNLERLNPVQVDLVVSQGLPPMSLSQLRELEVGQLIFITPADDCTVTANGMPFALGQLGEANGERAVRLTSRL
jgi:flagellar motor switch protein FliM